MDFGDFKVPLLIFVGALVAFFVLSRLMRKLIRWSMLMAHPELSPVLFEKEKDTADYKERLQVAQFKYKGFAVAKRRAELVALGDAQRTTEDLAMEMLDIRMNEARIALTSSSGEVTMYTFIAKGLTGCQYVLGSLIALGSVKNFLSAWVQAALGGMVVAATAMKQHYHPEVNLEQAQERVNQLGFLVMDTEDMLTDYRVAKSKSDLPDALLKRITEHREMMTKRIQEIMAFKQTKPARDTAAKPRKPRGAGRKGKPAVRTESSPDQSTSPSGQAEKETPTTP